MSVTLKAYKSHKIVHAGKITSIDFDVENDENGVIHIEGYEDGLEIEAAYFLKHKPQVGGYVVRYEDGYMSWSPADAFETGYIEMKPVGDSPGPYGLLHLGRGDFSTALRALKDGHCVRRSSWGGAHFVFMRPSDELSKSFIMDVVKSLPQSLKQMYRNVAEFMKSQSEETQENYNNSKVVLSAYLCKAIDANTINNGWLPSQCDLLADDWCIVNA